MEEPEETTLADRIKFIRDSLTKIEFARGHQVLTEIHFCNGKPINSFQALKDFRKSTRNLRLI